MKNLSRVLCATTLCLLGACATDDSELELDEVEDEGVEKDDGSTNVWIEDTIPWRGQNDQVTKVFKTARQFKDYFGEAAPAEIDFSQEWAIYYAAGAKPTGGYRAEILKVQLSASRKTLTVHAETAQPGDGCFVTQAFTKPATLITVRKRGPETTRFQTRRTTFARHCEAKCGDVAKAQLEYGARGAFYPSEGDEPYKAVSFPNAGTATLTKERMLEILGRAASTNIDEEPWTSWIAGQTTVEDDTDDYYKELAEHMKQLGQSVDLHLTDVKVFDVGFEDNGDGVRPLYIIGRTTCGELVGLQTTIVAT